MMNMIRKLSDDYETLVNAKDISFLRMSRNYHESERLGTCYYPLACFYFIIGIGSKNLDCSYSLPLNKAGEPDITKNPEIWAKLRSDYEALEEMLLKKQN